MELCSVVSVLLSLIKGQKRSTGAARFGDKSCHLSAVCIFMWIIELAFGENTIWICWFEIRP